MITELAREIWLANRLWQHGAAIFEGVTDRDTRRERAMGERANGKVRRG